MIDLGQIAAQRGLIIKRPPVPGKITRYPTIDHPGSLNGVLLLRPDGSGWAQNWAIDTAPVPFGDRVEFDPPAQAKLAAARKAETARIEAERHAVAAQIGAKRDTSPAVTFTSSRSTSSLTARGRWRDSLLVPYSIAGTIMTLQRIAPDGAKRFAKGGRKHGAYCAIGGRPSDRMVIVEGWATGCSVHEATGLPVAVAGDAGNLKPVAIALRRAFPAVEIIIAADHDAVGIDRARDAASGASGRFVVPQKEGDDFNDLHVAAGLNAVREIILEATRD